HLLTKVWPHPLRPLPATTILQFLSKDGNRVYTVEKDSEVKSSVVRKDANSAQPIIFRLYRTIQVLPLQINEVNVQHDIDKSKIILDLNWFGETKDGQWPVQPLMFYLGNNRKTARILI